MVYLLDSRTTSLKVTGNLGLCLSCDKRQETLMLGIGNSNKNILKNKPTSSLSKNPNSNLSHPHHLPDHLINPDPLTTNLQTPSPALVQLNRLLKSWNWQVNLTQRENSLPKSINIVLLITCVCIAVLAVIKPLTALTPKRLKWKLRLPLSPDPSLRIRPQSRKKAEQSTDVDTRGGLWERLCRCFTNCILECSGLSHFKFT